MKYWMGLFCVLFLAVSCDNSTSEDAEKVELSQEDLESLNSIEEVTQLLEKDPNNGLLLNKRALMHLQKGDAKSAKNDIREALKTDSLNAEYFITRGKIYASTIEMERALRDFQYARDLDTTYAEAYLGIAKIYYLAQNPEIAMKNLDQSLRLDPYQKEPYFYKGLIFKDYNDFKSAASSFQTALEQDPNYYDAYVELGILYAGIKKPIALEYFNSALRIDSSGIDAHYARAKYFQDIDSLDTALVLYKQITHKLDPTFSPAYFNQGYIFMMEKEKYDSALVYFDLATKVDTGYTQAYHNMGVIYQLADKKQEAKKYYEKALEANKNFELSREALINLYK